MYTESCFWFIEAYILIYSSYSTEANINNTYGYKDEENFTTTITFYENGTRKEYSCSSDTCFCIGDRARCKNCSCTIKRHEEYRKRAPGNKNSKSLFFWSLLFLKVVPPEIWKTILVVIYECLFRRTYFFGW